MKACNCTLPLEACKSCPIYLENQNIFSEPAYVYSPIVPNSKTKRITKTVKKYNKRGKLKGENIIIIEEEIFDKSNLPTISWNDGTGAPNPYKTTCLEKYGVTSVKPEYTSTTHEIDNSVTEKSTTSINNEKISNNI